MYKRVIFVIVLFVVCAGGVSAQDTRIDPLVIVLGTAPLDEATPSLDMVRRVEEGVRIASRYAHSKILFTGGKTVGVTSEAAMMAGLAYARGVSPARVLLEDRSLTTVENAEFSAAIAGGLPIKRSILVSRPTHLKRAKAAFSRYRVFGPIQTVPSVITREEIVANLQGYLARHDSERVRQILNKIVREYEDAGD
jgi:uncharacterized SAM-binding protein YcdF (DUF218 family)